MKELLRDKGTKSHMAEVPKRAPLATFTFYLLHPDDGLLASLKHVEV
jgi:hypothetical protein